MHSRNIFQSVVSAVVGVTGLAFLGMLIIIGTYWDGVRHFLIGL